MEVTGFGQLLRFAQVIIVLGNVVTPTMSPNVEHLTHPPLTVVPDIIWRRKMAISERDSQADTCMVN